ncbi:hypothetical protein SAMN05660971_04254 [Halomonas cupida]|uniref:Uncharacterized protein n=1 Tax=Halomonas cupida TaxID=44933 RepID=A0A1M7MKW6_9GAMM|nr:hypothetical protein SAMN05660971_04254 [Halomonas cupida]
MTQHSPDAMQPLREKRYSSCDMGYVINRLHTDQMKPNYRILPHSKVYIMANILMKIDKLWLNG